MHNNTEDNGRCFKQARLSNKKKIEISGLFTHFQLSGSMQTQFVFQLLLKRFNSTVISDKRYECILNSKKHMKCTDEVDRLRQKMNFSLLV